MMSWGAIIGAMTGRLAEHGVTRREAEVLAALSEGLTNAEIAARLYVSERTVESHVSSLLRKLQAGSRRELARLAHDWEGLKERRESSFPTGTVTFLLSDIEGSTRCWEESPESMAVAVRRHYALLEEAIVGHGGVRPLEQGEGDSVVGAFSRASDAVAAAVSAQRAMVHERWPAGAELRVRIAVHTGEAGLVGENSYFGEALNRCARLRAIGHGGQLLTSASTAELVAGRLAEGVTLVDLGLHRLKDLARAEHVWQVIHPDLPSEFPPLRSLDVVTHNLPGQLTPLVGRTSEIAELRYLIAEERMVTLIGAAGVGKTRLALAVAAEALEAKRGGVWWVELAPLSDPDAVYGAALAATGAREVSGSTIIHQLAVELGTQPSLLVLDNCEHLIDSCAELVVALLCAAPSVSVLATSRQPLGVPGEVTWRAPSLSSPPPDAVIDIAMLAGYDAVALFVQQARRAQPSFSLDEADAATVAQICWRLDGIPLALELAAARCRQMSVRRIAAELDNRFRLLTGGARTVAPRQQTLIASVEWSYELLDEAERKAFRRLAGFAGPFPLEAAETVVAAGGDVEPAEVFEVVTRLVDKSLVVVYETPRGDPRYRLLETLRAYAVDRARTAGELTLIGDTHASWWTEWLEPTFSMPTDAILEEVAEFHDNLRAALDWSVNDAALGLRLLRSLARVWAQLGRYGDAIPAADFLLGAENAERHPSAWLAAAEASLYLYMATQGAAAWHALLDRIEEVAARTMDKYHLALARQHRGGREEGTRARELARQRGDRYLTAYLTLFVAFCLAEDDPAAAGSELAGAEALTDASGNRELRVQMLAVKASAARCAGDLRRCIELGRQTLAHPHPTRMAETVSSLSYAALLSCDEDALRLAASSGEREARRAPGFAEWFETARHRLGLFEGQHSEVSADLRSGSEGMMLSFGTLWLECREAIDAGNPTVALEGVRTLTRPVPHGRAVLAAVEAAATGDAARWQDALALAVNHQLRPIAVDALEGLGIAASRNQQWSESLLLLASAQRLRDETGYQWRFTSEQQAVEAAQTAAHDALGNDAAQAAYHDGRNLEWHEAADYARRARSHQERADRPSQP